MANLDSIEQILKLDEENILSNIQDFPDQVERCWGDWKKIPIPTPFINTKNILVCGMGGSAQGAEIVSNLAYLQAKIPIFIIHDYDIPAWVDKNTLVIGSSYSGSTEETISAFQKASQITDKLITISTGGKLYSLGTQKKALHYQVKYGSQPRAALGYMLTSILAIFKKLNFVEISDEDIKEAVLLLRAIGKKLDVSVPINRNMAKIFAKRLVGKIPIVYGSGNLRGVSRRWKGQFNESAKTASYFEILPELNHNSLSGLKYPEDLRQKLFFVILQSKYDHERNTLRQNITAQILQQKKLAYETVMMQPPGNQIAEVLQTIYLGDYISYYLAILNDVKPSSVDIIGFLKEKLAEKPLVRSKLWQK